MTEPPDTFIQLYDDANGVASIDASDGQRVDAAVSKWVDSGQTKDTILYLTMVDGREYRILASRVGSWVLSTREGRKRAIALEKAYEEEEADMKSELGIWDGA